MPPFRGVQALPELADVKTRLLNRFIRHMSASLSINIYRTGVWPGVAVLARSSSQHSSSVGR